MCADGPVQGGGVEGRVRATNVMNTYCVPDSELQIITIIGIFRTHSKGKGLYVIISCNPYNNPPEVDSITCPLFQRRKLSE